MGREPAPCFLDVGVSKGPAGPYFPETGLGRVLGVDQKDELPSYLAGFAEPVRLGDLGERERPHGREGEAAGVDQVADLGQHVERPPGVTPAEPHPVGLRRLGTAQIWDCAASANQKWTLPA